MTPYRMAGNASFSLGEPRVTDGTHMDIQIGPRACNGCGVPFRPKRSWQKQCSARCRQRAYVRRQPMKTVSYYGAWIALGKGESWKGRSLQHQGAFSSGGHRRATPFRYGQTRAELVWSSSSCRAVQMNSTHRGRLGLHQQAFHDQRASSMNPPYVATSDKFWRINAIRAYRGLPASSTDSCGNAGLTLTITSCPFRKRWASSWADADKKNGLLSMALYLWPANL